MRILVLDRVKEAGVKVLQRPGWDVDFSNGSMDEEELVSVIGGYDAIIVRSATKVTAKAIAAGRRLKVIGRAGVGVDNIDLEAATANGIMVVNAPDGNTIAAAEHTMALMLALARNVPQGDRSLKEGRWERKKLIGAELRHKTLGILGLGRIGSAVARRAQAFEMKCIVYDPYVSGEYAAELGVELASLEEVLEVADFLTLHLPLRDSTRYLLNEERLRQVKRGARIVNVARGGLIDEQALVQLIEEGHIAGAAVDVFEEEPVQSSPLLTCKNVVLTPHLGASTEEAQLKVAADVAEEIANILQGGLPRNAVNMGAVPPEALAKARPFLPLATGLGSFVAQVAGGVDRLKVTFSGELLSLQTRPITTAVLQGLLDKVVAEDINLINANYTAEQRGLKLETVHRQNGEDYPNKLTVQAESAEGSVTVAGVLFHDNNPRIVEIDGYRVDVNPDGYMLIAPHQDKPGIIGFVGSVLGEAKINIAAMQVGRKQPGGKAVMVLRVDCKVPDDILARIAEVEGILSVKQVIF